MSIDWGWVLNKRVAHLKHASEFSAVTAKYVHSRAASYTSSLSLDPWCFLWCQMLRTTSQPDAHWAAWALSRRSHLSCNRSSSLSLSPLFSATFAVADKHPRSWCQVFLKRNECDMRILNSRNYINMYISDSTLHSIWIFLINFYPHIYPIGYALEGFTIVIWKMI